MSGMIDTEVVSYPIRFVHVMQCQEHRPLQSVLYAFAQSDNHPFDCFLSLPFRSSFVRSASHYWRLQLQNRYWCVSNNKNGIVDIRISCLLSKQPTGANYCYYYLYHVLDICHPAIMKVQLPLPFVDSMHLDMISS